jgi:hypothetical protein
MKLKQLLLKQVLHFWTVLAILYISGCSATRPSESAGVLSSIQQKTLNLATVRAIQQANLDLSQLKGKDIYLDVGVVGSADLGKQHVAAQIPSLLQSEELKIVSSKDAASSTIKCNMNIAGVDTRYGDFLFWRWVDTIAEVEMVFEVPRDGNSEKRKGDGTAKFHQGWFLGFGPSASLE